MNETEKKVREDLISWEKEPYYAGMVEVLTKCVERRDIQQGIVNALADFSNYNQVDIPDFDEIVVVVNDLIQNIISDEQFLKQTK